MSTKKDKNEGTKLPPLTEAQQRFNAQFDDAIKGRQTSCFWGTGTDTEHTSNGSDWEQRWSLQEQLAIPWVGNLSQEDGYKSNVKSPEISGRIDSTMQKLVKLNLEFVARPKRPEVKEFAKIYEIIINNTFRKQNVKYRLRDAFYNALVHGSAPVTIDYVLRKRKVKMPINNPDDMTEEQKKALKEKNEIPYIEVEKIDTRDVVISNRRLQELYFDPTARNIHEDLYYCSYYFRTMMIPHERFVKHYKGRAGYENIDKVRKIKEIEETQAADTSFFKPPKNFGGDYVYLVEGYDYDNDVHMVRANDIFINGPEGKPLPYAHKDLNVVMLTPKKQPDQLYGIGIVDALLPVITQMELLQNAIYDYVIYTANPMMAVEKNSYADFSRHYRHAKPGMLLPVLDVNRAFAPIKFAPLSLDIFQALESLRRDAIIASQQDPSQLGVVAKNATATANIMNQQITDAYVNYTVINFEEALNEIARQTFWLHHQFLSKNEVYTIIKGGKAEKETRSVSLATPEREYEIDWEQLKITGDTYTQGKDGSLELKPDLFFYKNKEGKRVQIVPDDFDIELSTESKEILNQAVEAQRMKESIAQLANYMVDPNDKQKVAMHPAPWINGPSLLQEFFEKNKIDTKHLLNSADCDKEAIAKAQDQNKQMFNLERAIPEPGEPEKHVETHEQFAESLNAMKKKLEESVKMEQAQMQQQMMANPMAMMNPGMMPQPSPEAQKAMSTIQHLDQVLQIVTEHIKLDTQPAYMKVDVQAQAMSPQAPMPQGYEAGPTINMTGSDSGMPGAPNTARMGGMTQGGPGQLGGMAGMVEQGM